MHDGSGEKSDVVGPRGRRPPVGYDMISRVLPSFLGGDIETPFILQCLNDGGASARASQMFCVSARLLEAVGKISSSQKLEVERLSDGFGLGPACGCVEGGGGLGDGEGGVGGLMRAIMAL